MPSTMDLQELKIWNHIIAGLPNANSWILGGDINMVKRDAHKSRNPSQKLLEEE